MIPLFQTQNAALASTLATCGVPFYKDTNGVPCPFLNIYDAELLRRLGYSGLTLEEAARRAWRSGKKGLLVYSFERNDLANRISEPTNSVFWASNAAGITNAIGSYFAPASGSTNYAPASGSTNYATAAQGALADTALQPGASWTNISGLGTAATTAATNYATAAQGAKADTAAQQSTTITAGTGLTGGGDLSANRTIALAADAARANLTGGNGSLDLSLYTITLPSILPATSGQNMTSLNATQLTSGTVPAARLTSANLPTITVNFSGVLHNSPMTITAGNGTATLANQTANTIMAGPTSGNATAPTFRALVNSDIPQTLSLTGNFTAGDAAADEFVANDDDPRFPNLTAAAYAAAADDKVAINGNVGDAKYVRTSVTSLPSPTYTSASGANQCYLLEQWRIPAQTNGLAGNNGYGATFLRGLFVINSGGIKTSLQIGPAPAIAGNTINGWFSDSGTFSSRFEVSVNGGSVDLLDGTVSSRMKLMASGASSQKLRYKFTVNFAANAGDTIVMSPSGHTFIVDDTITDATVWTSASVGGVSVRSITSGEPTTSDTSLTVNGGAPITTTFVANTATNTGTMPTGVLFPSSTGVHIWSRTFSAFGFFSMSYVY